MSPLFIKSMRELLRDPWSLVLALLTAPAFLLLYWALTGGGSTTYRVLLLDEDRPAVAAVAAVAAVGDGAPATATTLHAGAQVRAALMKMAYPNGQPMLRVQEVADRDAARRALENREAALLVELPENLSASLAVPSRDDAGATTRAQVRFLGDQTNPLYAVAAVLAFAAIDDALLRERNLMRPFALVEEPLGASGTRTEFESYVPGLLIVALIMVVFSTAMAVAREIERRTLQRLRLTKMTAFDFVAGVSLSQLVLALVSLGLTYALARLLGFRTVGPEYAAAAVAAITALAVIGVGLVVASFARTATRAFLVANLPFMLLAFFSGAVFPIPKVELLRVGEHGVGLWDLLPTTHAVVALNKVLSLGSGFPALGWELGWLGALSAVYFGAGVVLFHWRHLRRA